MDSDSSPFCLTLGIELEFIVLYNPEDYHDELQQWLAGEEKFYLTRLSPTSHQNYGFLVCRRMIQILNENGFSTNSYLHVDFSKWTVDTDYTVTAADNIKNWYAVELKTPVLDCSGPALKQVETVVELLGSKFKLYTNESCGLHVHVGNEDRGFDLRTLQNFCSLVLAFRHQFDSLHSPDRLKNEYVKPIRMEFDPEAPLREKLSFIDNSNTVDDLVSLMHHPNYDGYLAYGFLKLRDNPGIPFRTIEFRQHQSTLDPERITNWVMMAYNLVGIAHNDSAGLSNLIEKHSHKNSYTILDLFNDLKLPDLAKFYAPLVFPQYGMD